MIEITDLKTLKKAIPKAQSNNSIKQECVKAIANIIGDELRHAYCQLASKNWGGEWEWRIFWDVETEHQQIIIDYENKKINLLTRIKQTNIFYQDSPLMQEIKKRITIRDILNHYQIKIRGRMALCPFHDDHEPSLSFNEEKGLWNCFGCGKSGNMITLVQELENLK